MNARQVLEAAHRLQQNDQAFALVSVLRVEAPASARPGDKAVVTADGIIHGWIGGGCAQPAVLRTVREALADGRSRVIRIAPADAETPGPSTTAVNSERRLEDILEFGMTCHSGGILELFIDPIVAQTQLTIIGDTPLAAALCELAPRVGLTVTVIAHQADPGRFPAADRVLTNDEDAPGIARQHASLNGCFIVVATQGRRDLQGLRLALSLPGRQTFFCGECPQSPSAQSSAQRIWGSSRSRRCNRCTGRTATGCPDPRGNRTLGPRGGRCSAARADNSTRSISPPAEISRNAGCTSSSASGSTSGRTVG